MTPPPPPPPPPRSYTTLFLFSMTTLLLFADQNLMSPNLTAIADEFNLDHEERDRKLGGDISLAFFLLGAPASLVVGCLADASDRSFLFASTVAIGEGACLATYFVTNYAQLYICRAVTGFSIGGALPLIYSILGDLYVPKDRHIVSALVSFGTGAGIAIGQAIAGFLGPVYGWRVPFAVVAIPALLCAWGVYLLVPDPERGAAERWAEYAERSRKEEEEEECNGGNSSIGGHVETLVPLSLASSPATMRSSNTLTTLQQQQEEREDEDDYYLERDDGVALVPVSSFSSMNNNINSNDNHNNRRTTRRHSSNSLSGLNDNNDSGVQQRVSPEQDDYYLRGDDDNKQKPEQLWRYQTVDDNDDDDNNTPSPTSSYRYRRHDVFFYSYYSNTLHQVAHSFWTSIRTHLQNTQDLLGNNPTFFLALIQGAPGCIPWGILNTFLNDFLAQDRGFSIELATTTLMCFSVGHVFGLILGGIGGSRLYTWDVRYPAVLAGGMAIFGCFPFWWLLNGVDAENTPFWKVAGIAILAGFGSGPTGPIIKATITNVTPPTARGQAFALCNLFDDFGKGLGPFAVSVLIVQLGGRLQAFNVGVFGWVLCGVANLAIFYTIEKDEANMVATVMYKSGSFNSSIGGRSLSTASLTQQVIIRGGGEEEHGFII